MEPESAQSVIVSSGERYDVLVKTKENPKKNYYIRGENMESKTKHEVIFPSLFYFMSCDLIIHLLINQKFVQWKIIL